MIGILVALLVISTVFQCVYSMKATGDWANPVVIFCGIHFVHNWVRSFFYCFDDYYALGGVLIDITDRMVADNLLRNLIGLWTFFFIFILCRCWWKEKRKTSSSIWIFPRGKSLNLFWGAYIAFTLFGFVLGGRSSEQALTADAAFSGIAGIIGIRSFFLMYVLINAGFQKRIAPMLIAFPIELVLAGGARKMLMMTLLAWLFAYAYAHAKTMARADILPFLKRASWMLLPAYLVLFFMSARRSANGRDYDTTSEALFGQIDQICISPVRIFSPLCATDSESVQIWCSELVSQGTISLMYGKTYIQAILNMVVLRPFQGEVVSWQAAYAFKTIAYPTFTNHGWDFTFVAETVLNWGNHFFFISFAIFSLVLNYFYKKRDTSLFWQCLYFIFIVICFVTFRTDSTAMLRFLSFFLAVALVARFFKLGQGVQVFFRKTI